MTSAKLLSLSTLALLPLLSFAAPAPAPVPVSAATAAIQWIPIDEVNGQTLYLNSALLPVSPNPSLGAIDSINAALADSDQCDGTTLNPHPSPFANSADCIAIADWAATANRYWGVWDNTPDTHGVLYLGTCVFEAGTYATTAPRIGSSNIADITYAGVNALQYNGVVAAQGETTCNNNAGGGHSTVRWTIKHS